MRARRAALVAAALVVAVTAAGCGGGSEPPRSQGSGASLTTHPVPSGAEVVAMAGAEVDQDFFATNDAGDLLSSVVVFRHESTEWCQTPSPAALVWSGHDGARRTFTGDVMARMIAPVAGGFVVGAVRPDCQRSEAGPHGSPDAYLVTSTGRTVEISWPAGELGDEARRVCAPDPTDTRCVFSAEDGSLRFRPMALAAPSGGTPSAMGDLLVVPPTEQERLWWSTDDGASWGMRDSVLSYPRSGGIYTTGDVPVMSNGTDVELTTDGGGTWSSGTCRPRSSRSA